MHLCTYLWKTPASAILFFIGITFGVNGLTWFDAREKCRSENDRLGTLPISNKSSWTLYYQRRSHWIRSLGCYSDENHSFKKRPNISMIIPSAGLCQERCIEKISKNVFTFAVQNSTCICLNEPPQESWLLMNQSKYYCMKNWSEFREKSSYSVFVSVTNLQKRTVSASKFTCLALKCNTKNKFHVKECHINFGNIKKSIGWSSFTKGKRVNTTHDVGNDLLSMFNKTCEKSHGQQKHNKSWVAFARQNYTTIDQGRDVDRTDIISCQLCRYGGCSFEDCNFDFQVEKIACSKTIFPGDPPMKTTIKTNSVVNEEYTLMIKTRYTTHSQTKPGISKTLINPQKTITSDEKETTRKAGYMTSTLEDLESSSKGGEENDKQFPSYSLIAIAGPVFSLVVTACVICLVIKCIRKKNLAQKGGSEMHTNSAPGDIKTEETSSKKYSVTKNMSNQSSVGACAYELADNGKLKEENTFADEEESQYDLLRETIPRKNMEEDTYDHLQIENESSYSTFTTEEQQGMIDSTYDHVEF